MVRTVIVLGPGFGGGRAGVCGGKMRKKRRMVCLWNENMGVVVVNVEEAKFTLYTYICLSSYS